MKTSPRASKRKHAASPHEDHTDDRVRQILGAIPPGARLPRHQIVKRTGLPAHIVQDVVELLVNDGRLRSVKASSEGGQKRGFYERVMPPATDGVPTKIVDAADIALLAALSVNRLYEMYRLARLADVGTPIMRMRVSALVESGHLVVVKTTRGDRTLTRYRLARTALSETDATTETVAETAHDAPRASATDVFCAMAPNTGYRVSELAKKLGLALPRMNELLAVLQRDGRVVRIMETQARNPHPLFYVAGSEPRVGAPPRIKVPTPWTERPTFDEEYGRQLRSLRDIAEASR